MKSLPHQNIFHAQLLVPVLYIPFNKNLVYYLPEINKAQFSYCTNVIALNSNTQLAALEK
jgi:hypothetical protein